VGVRRYSGFREEAKRSHKEALTSHAADAWRYLEENFDEPFMDRGL
jgi:hypothetical protein